MPTMNRHRDMTGRYVALVDRRAIGRATEIPGRKKCLRLFYAEYAARTCSLDYVLARLEELMWK